MVNAEISAKLQSCLSPEQVARRRQRISATWSPQERRRRARRASVQMQLLWGLLSRGEASGLDA